MWSSLQFGKQRIDQYWLLTRLDPCAVGRSIYYLKPSAIACPQRASGPIIEILLAVPFQGTLKNLLYLKRPSSHVCRHMYGVRDYVLRPIIMYGANVVTASGQIGGEIF